VHEAWVANSICGGRDVVVHLEGSMTRVAGIGFILIIIIARAGDG
jgi:hypothetical protein